MTPALESWGVKWVSGNGAMEVAILLLVNTSKVPPVSAETQMGTVLGKHRALQSQWLCHPAGSPLGLVFWHRLRHSLKGGQTCLGFSAF